MRRRRQRQESDMDDVVVVINPMPRGNNSSAVSVGKFMNILPRSVHRIWVASAGYCPSMFAVEQEVITGSHNRQRGLVGSLRAQVEACNVVRRSCASVAFFWIADTMVLPYLYCKARRMTVYNYVIGDWKYFSSMTGIENRIRNRIRRMMALHADINCVESLHVLDNWTEVQENTKVKVTPLYVESEVFDQSVPIGDRGNVIGMVGRLASSKNVMEALKGFEDFSSSEGNWELVVVGEGPLKAEVVAYAEGAHSRIRVLGWQSRGEVAALLNSFKCILMPTLTEGLPNTLLEAMTCGTPALATPISGIKDLVFEGQTGWLLDGTDAGHIAEGLRRAMLATEDHLEDVSARAKKYVDLHYSLEASRARMAEALQGSARDVHHAK